MSASQVLQQLYSLDPSSADFLRVLYALIRYDAGEQYSSGLKGEELARLVDFLDNALCFIHPSDDVFRRCLRKLRAICGSHTTLPSSYIISGNLTRIGESPFAYGGFADVWQGDQDGKRVCIKASRIPLNDTEGLKKLFFKEAVMWKRLKHPNVVPFLGVTIDPFQFVSEWMPNGTLTHYVTKNPGANRIALVLDVAEGLSYLHASYMIHGDLKGPNILIKNDGHACLADFGLASIVHGNNTFIPTDARGHTARWTAPEVLQGVGKITREADVFSFGMVVIESFTGRWPLSELGTSSVILKTVTGERPAYPQGTEALGFVTPIWNMTIECWKHEPAHRPAIATVVEFLRECYTLHIIDPSLSTLSPWKPNLNAGYGIISPTTPYDNLSPTQSTGTSRESGNLFFPTQEHAVTQSPTSNALSPGVAHASRTSLEYSLSDESRANLNPDRRRKATGSSTSEELLVGKGRLHRASSAPSQNNPSSTPATRSGSIHRSGNASPKRQDGKKEKPPQKTGKARWRELKAVIWFAFAKPTSKENQDRG